MDKLFETLKGYFKKPPVIIDNLAFRLHYRATIIILFAFSALVTTKQYFGDPIDCIAKNEVPSKMLDTFCWLHTTFSIENAWEKRVGVDVPYPGVDKTTPNEKRVHHAYYQWVCFVLFFQGLLFMVPRYLWKAYEGGTVAKLVNGLNMPLGNEKNEPKIRQLVEYLRSYENQNNRLFYFYIFMETLNFVNVIGQMFLMDGFLGGEFSTYGWNVITFTQWNWEVRFDPMIKVFPRLTKCTFFNYGASGDIQKYDAMCVLPINILNEKIYVFLWFWFYLVAIVTFCSLIYRMITIFSVQLRISRTKAHCRLVNKYELENICRHKSIGDWFMIDLLARNMDASNFRRLISTYVKPDDEKV